MVLSRNLHSAGQVVVNGEYLKDAVIRYFRTEESKVHVVYLGVDTIRYSPDVSGAKVRTEMNLSSDTPVILTVGGISPRKGQLRVVRAMPYIVQRFPTAHICFVGDVSAPEYHSEVRKAAEALGLSERVHYTGWVAQERVPEYMAAADVVAILSSDEGMPEVLMQAMASGKAIVASHIPQCQEVQRREGEIAFVDQDDPAQVGAVISRLLENPACRLEMGSLARRTAEEHYTWRKTAEGYVRVYEQAMASKKRE
jgi:glycosyltransferase involved in cell wall biosynthesis